MRFYIYSGTYEQARTLTRMMDIGRHEWSYINSPEVLLGRRGGTILMYGTWRERPEEEQTRIKTMAHTNMMAVVYVKEQP